MSRWVFTCEPGWEGVLAAELARVFPDAAHWQTAFGWVESEFMAPPTGTPCVAFTSQCLPDAEPLSADSISAWSRQAGAWLIEQLREHAGPWRLHVFPFGGPEGDVGSRRAQLVKQGILDVLKQKQRRLLRSLVNETQSPFTTEEALVQIGLATRSTGFMSCCGAPHLPSLRRCISRFPGGVVDIQQDRTAPSRAFRKLAEVEIRLGRPISAGETCVDLGSSPGSWAWLALARGASVVAIDRSPLREDLMQNPQLEFARGDAFRYTPPQPVDWLLSDVIAYPARVEELLEAWLSEDRCRFFCVTVKFQGEEEYARLEAIKRLLETRAADFELRRLTSNKNEVTAFGRSRAALTDA
jgi:23S rRNA (cytidine2498-2'-O)-methyltransferase